MNWFSIVKDAARRANRLIVILEGAKVFLPEDLMTHYINRITENTYLEVIEQIDNDFRGAYERQFNNPQVRHFLEVVMALIPPNEDNEEPVDEGIDFDHWEGFGEEFR
jgi:hypothetical protein